MTILTNIGQLVGGVTTGGIAPAIEGVSTLFSTLLDKAFPNPEDKAKAEAIVLSAQVQNTIATLHAENEVMLAEANSSDKWTSRARPSFFYIFYAFLLCAIPMAIIGAFSPELAKNIANSFGFWLAAIPDQLFNVFITGYLGYTTARTWEKHSNNQKDIAIAKTRGE